MRQVVSRDCLLPPGLNVDEIRIEAGGVFVSARMPGGVARCPSCGSMSGRIQSRYRRALSDLPAHGRQVRVELLVRRFRCAVRSCQVKVFAERPGDGITKRYRQRTTRLQGLVLYLGLALGGRPAQALASRLLLPVSKDTLLRSIGSGIPTPEAAPPPRIIGIDDWAWKKGHRYGTIICDLERRQVIDLLPDREAVTVEAWLRAHPGIQIVSRDRGGGYGQAVGRALPNAVQVADRWHLLENASRAFADAVHNSMRDIRRVLGANACLAVRLTVKLFSSALVCPYGSL